jgi:general secretion pathway protein G
MPYCAWCGQEVANVSSAPCPHCGKPINGGTYPSAPPPAAGGGSRTAIIIVVVIAVVLVGVAIVGILAAIAIPNLLTAQERSKQKRTMADLRTIATSIEARATDKNEYPDVQNFTDLRPLLEPEYVHMLPLVDAWGHPFRYACTSYQDGHCNGYALASSGKDGLFENDDLKAAAQSPPAPTKNFDCDIIYANGKFVEYPEAVGGM